MARDTDSSANSHISRDSETIRRWAEDHNVVPVRHTGDTGESRLELVEESSHTDRHERVDWDTLHDEIEHSDQVVVYHEDRNQFEVLGRDETVQRASINSEQLEESLLAGETVTSEITETTVVERTIVEQAEIESEVVDREVIDSQIVNGVLQNRVIEDCHVTDMADTEQTDYGQFETGARTTDELDVRVEVTEDWVLTREEIEEIVIESEVVDTDETETDTVESDRIEESIEIEGVQQTILEGDLLESGAEPTAVMESDAIESEFREGSVVDTRLTERRTVEEQMTLDREFTGHLTEGETVGVETVSTTMVDQGFGGQRTGETTGDVAETASGATPVPTADDEGKDVVDAHGEKVGEVMSVEETVTYVDPDPSLADKIMRTLNWGSDDDAYPVDSDHINRITDDTVELNVER